MATFDFFKYFCSLVSGVPLQWSVAHYSPCHAGDRTWMGRSIFGGVKEQGPLSFTAWDLAQPWLWGLFSESILDLSVLGSHFPSWPTAWLHMGYAKLETVSFFYKLLECHLIGHNIQKDRLESLVQHLVLIFIVPITFILPYRKLTLLMVTLVLKIEKK